MNLGELVKLFGIGGAIVISMAGWFSWFIVQRLLQREKATLEKKLEQEKFELERIAQEHIVRFQWLHEKRAVEIERIYKQLRQINHMLFSKYQDYYPISNYQDDVDYVETDLENIHKSIAEFRNTAQDHPLYFSKDLAMAIEHTVERLKLAEHALLMDNISRKQQNEEELSDDEANFIMMAPPYAGEQFLQGEINESRAIADQVMEQLASEFRILLGSKKVSKQR